jgi:PAS domain S-box-containing protein
VPDHSKTADCSDLRERAEELLRAHGDGPCAPLPEDVQRLVHELEVHQVELEMQNEALREAQRELEASRDRYADLYDFAPVGYVTLDQNGLIRQINLTAAGMLGAERSQLIGRPFARYVLPEHKNAFHAHVRRCIADGCDLTSELPLAARDGRSTWVQFRSAPARDDDGTATLCRTSVVDISDRKLAGEALRKAHDELERRVEERTAELSIANQRLEREVEERSRAEASLQESQSRSVHAQRVARMGFWEWKIATGELYWSDEIYRTFGLSKEQARVTYDAFLAAVHPDDRDLVRRSVDAAVRESAAYDIEHRIVRPGGEVRFVHEQGDVYCDAEGRPLRMLGTVRDITSRKNLERELSEISTVEQQRVGWELHEGLGQQMLGLRFLAKALEKSLSAQGMAEAGVAGKVADALHDCQVHIRALIDGVRPVDVDANGLMAALANLAENTCTVAGVSCTFDCGRPVLMRDSHAATQLFHIAQEAVRNAVKHGKPSRITIGLESHDRQVTLQVRDDRTGIPSDPDQIGGMGLRIMRYRAGVLGADLKIQPADGGGTLVTCTLHQEERHELEH